MTLRQKNVEIYWAWKSMKQRTQNPKCSAYKNYGARGIRVCEAWQKFEPFCEWALSAGWRKGLDLDRIDNNGNYCPENCRWATRQDNVNNRRVTVFIKVNGERKTCSQWSKESGIPQGTLNVWHLNKGEQYVASRIVEAKEHGYIEKDYSYNHVKKPIINLDTGQRYCSFRDAVKSTGISSAVIWKSLKSGKRSKHGLFVYDDCSNQRQSFSATRLAQQRNGRDATRVERQWQGAT